MRRRTRRSPRPINRTLDPKLTRTDNDRPFRPQPAPVRLAPPQDPARPLPHPPLSPVRRARHLPQLLLAQGPVPPLRLQVRAGRGLLPRCRIHYHRPPRLFPRQHRLLLGHPRVHLYPPRHHPPHPLFPLFPHPLDGPRPHDRPQHHRPPTPPRRNDATVRGRRGRELGAYTEGRTNRVTARRGRG